MKTFLQIHGFENSSIAYCEAMGLSKVFQAYAENSGREEISYGGIGFNPCSGYVYIALENGVQIASCMGREVNYIVVDPDSGEEFFLESYQEALDKLNEIHLANFECAEEEED